uniref:TPR-repeat-containing protein n=1 Tax=Nonomuraea gerenzanensis TaxID=93944 RepID=A0A1M4EHI6_9ACTN|nr:TPR-repeat-containing protein [Nonomuraea gerenzanensis]
MAAERALEEDDADRAHEHTKVARRFAARIGVVREAAGIVAYRAGHFSEALSDLRAARRMTGSDAYLPVMADCERGMGRPERAIDLVRSPEAERLDRAGRIELTIVESGARRDLGQHDAAVITLQRLPELRDPQPKPWSARLAFAYADALADAGHQDAATDWFGRAMAFDEDGETDAAERYAELTGAVIEDVEEDFDEEDDFDDAGVSAAGDAAIADEEPDDDAALAEAGDLLDDDESISDEVDESSEEGESEIGDEPDEEERDSSAAEASDVASAEDDEDDEDEDDDEDDSDVVLLPEEVAEPEQPAKPEQPARPEQAGEAGKAAGAGEDAEPAEVKEAGEQAPGVIGITPAFIEPNFGDVLDADAESPAEKPKNED